MSSGEATAERSRWPSQVYAEGDEPDPRFSFANERTFLAWVRTSLALTAAGVAVHTLATGLGEGLRTAVSVMLVLLGLACGGFAFLRWAANERALRLDRPLPGFVFGALVSTVLLVGGVVIVVELVNAR